MYQQQKEYFIFRLNKLRVAILDKYSAKYLTGYEIGMDGKVRRVSNIKTYNSLVKELNNLVDSTLDLVMFDLDDFDPINFIKELEKKLDE